MKRLSPIPIIFSLLSCLSARAYAADFSDSISSSATADPLIDSIPGLLPELEVISQEEKPGIASPSPLYVVDATQIAHTGVSDIADALKRVPGVNLRDYGGAGGLKTVSVRGLGTQHTGVTYDGVPLSDLRSGEIDLSKYSIHNLSSLSLSAMDVEDIFIPAKALASASSIEISTMANPKNRKGFEGDLRMKTGSFGMYNPFFRVGYSNGTKISISAMGEFFHAKNNYPFSLKNGDYQYKEKRNNSRMNSTNGEINFLYRHSPSSSLNAKIYYYDNSRQLPGPVVYYVENSNEHLHDRNFFGQARWKARLSSIFSIMAIGKFNWTSSRYEDIKGIYPGGKLDQKYIQRETYASAALLFLPSSNWALDYSADWTFNNLSSNLPTDRRPYRNTILQALSAKYSISKVSVIARLLYSFFLNYSHEAKEANQVLEATRNTFQRLSPAVSVSVNPITDLPLYFRASYKNLFRMPTFNELYFDNFGSVNLKPEITDQFNLGATFSLPPGNLFRELSVMADGYYNRVRNKIVAVPYNLFKWSMTNLGDVRIWGLDLSLTAEFNLYKDQTLLFLSSYSYQRAMPHTSPDMLDWKKQVAYTPLNSGSASISWLNPWVSAALHGTGCSARYTTNSNIPSTRIPGYFDAGLSLFHTFDLKTGAIELRGELLNIFNHQYQVIARYPMPGRRWTFAVKYTF